MTSLPAWVFLLTLWRQYVLAPRNELFLWLHTVHCRFWFEYRKVLAYLNPPLTYPYTSCVTDILEPPKAQRDPELGLQGIQDMDGQ